MSKRIPPDVHGAKFGADVDLAKKVVRDSKGKRVTDASVQRLVTAAKRSGRPSLSGAKEKSPVIAVRVSPKIRAQAFAAAKAKGVSVSEYTRQALEESLKK